MSSIAKNQWLHLFALRFEFMETSFFEKRKFYFKGPVPSSKSIYNRALIVQSFFPELVLSGFSSCEDVVLLKQALSDLNQNKKEFFCGEGGTTFRFLAFRISRETGSFKLNMAPSLAQRPHQSIIDTLYQLGIDAEWSQTSLIIQSRGWQNPLKPLKIKSTDSSQFLSGLLLSAWHLDFSLEIDLSESISSESYFLMTLSMVKELGMNFHLTKSSLHIPPHQKIIKGFFMMEPDLSSCFSLAALGALCGKVEIDKFPFQSLQPDIYFLDIFNQMKIPWETCGESIIFKQKSFYDGISVDLSHCPDLFPVLATLCSFSTTPSKLFGAPQLKNKESNRIEKTSELLKLFGVPHRCLDDGLEVLANPSIDYTTPIEFNPDNDHRMVMAAALFCWKGYNLKIHHPHVVNKSFPEFLEIAFPQQIGLH